MKLILLGPPGAGKGTQAEILSKKLGVPTISTGNILRNAVKNGTKLGLEAKTYMDTGGLVPDGVIMGVIKERLSEADCRGGYILDGIPRTLVQAEAFEDEGIAIDTALLITISDEEIEERMTGRRVCKGCSATYHIKTNPPKTHNTCDSCGHSLEMRKDDEPGTVRNRLQVYHDLTEPLVEHYKDRHKLLVVNNQPSIEATTAVLYQTLGI